MDSSTQTVVSRPSTFLRLAAGVCAVVIYLSPLLHSTSKETHDEIESLIFQPPNITRLHEALHQESRRPVLVLHVGPMKTGTTTIQCRLRDLEEKGILRKHGIGLLETESCRPPGPSFKGVASYESVSRGKAFSPNCLMEWKPTLGGMPECWNASYYRFLQEASQNHSAPKDFIISNENLMAVFVKLRRDAALFIRDMANSLREAGNYRMHVIATYRHWHEWIVSVHQQRHKLVNTQRLNLRKYPGEGGKHVPTLPEFVKASRDEREFVHRALEFFQSGHRDGEAGEADVSVSLANMHAQPSLEHNFFCECLPASMTPAFEVCGSAGQSNASSVPIPKPNATLTQKTEESPRNHNVADHTLIMYDSLAVEALKRGWFSGRVPRPQVVIFLRRHFLKNKTPFFGNASSWPMKCPTGESMSIIRNKAELMLNATLKHWKELPVGVAVEGGSGGWVDVNGWDEERFRQDLEKSFSRISSSKKLCSIDSEATLAQNETAWKKLFRRLK